MFGIYGAHSVFFFWSGAVDVGASRSALLRIGVPADRRIGGIDVDLVGRPSVESVATVSLGNDGRPGNCTRVVAPPCGAAVARTAAPATVTARRVRLSGCFIGDSSPEEGRSRRGSADAVNEPAAVDVLGCYRLRELTWRLV